MMGVQRRMRQQLTHMPLSDPDPELAERKHSAGQREGLSQTLARNTKKKSRTAGQQARTVYIGSGNQLERVNARCGFAVPPAQFCRNSLLKRHRVIARNRLSLKVKRHVDQGRHQIRLLAHWHRQFSDFC